MSDAGQRIGEAVELGFARSLPGVKQAAQTLASYVPPGGWTSGGSLTTITAAAPEDGEPTTALRERAVVVITAEGEMSGDGRIFEVGGGTWREPPLSLTRNHDDDQLVGRIDHIWRDSVLYTPEQAEAIAAADTPPAGDESGPLIYGLVTFDIESEEGVRASRQVDGGFLRGVSMEWGDSVEEVECTEEDEDGFCIAGILHFLEYRIGNVTLTPFPAMETATVIASGVTVPDVPPAAWFDDPGLTEPTPLTITPEGRLFGHIGLWDSCHVGMPDCTTPPRCCDYDRHFHLGEVETDSGDLHCGVLTIGTGHLNDLRAGLHAAVAHYENTGTIAAYVRAGEDQFGPWIAGALDPGLDDQTIRHLRSAKPSGDWRPVRGTRQLCAVLAVNVPGFPVPRVRSLVAASGTPLALVAAAAPTLPRCGCGEHAGADLGRRVAQLEAVVASLGLADQAGEALAASIGKSA